MIPGHLPRFLFVGSYQPPDTADGAITGFSIAYPGGEIEPIGFRTSFGSAAHMVFDPINGVIHAANGIDEGRLASFRLLASGKLRSLGEWPAGEQGPCHLAVLADGRHLVAAHYAGGSVSLHRAADGARPGELLDLVRHQDLKLAVGARSPHPHAAVVTPDGARVAVADLGLDALLTYQVDVESPQLRRASVMPSLASPGAGPRHLVFHSAQRAFVVNELSSTVSSYRYDKGSGRFEQTAEVSTRSAPSSSANYPAELRISPDGRFLYVSNRGNDTISTFETTDNSLVLLTEAWCGGEWPQDLLVIGDRIYVANEHTGNVAVLNRDARSGVVGPVVRQVELPKPCCLLAC